MDSIKLTIVITAENYVNVTEKLCKRNFLRRNYLLQNETHPHIVDQFNYYFVFLLQIQCISHY
jgi:hypothetical protein